MYIQHKQIEGINFTSNLNLSSIWLNRKLEIKIDSLSQTRDERRIFSLKQKLQDFALTTTDDHQQQLQKWNIEKEYI